MKNNKQIIQLRTKRQLIGYITEGNKNNKDYWGSLEGKE
jgi:hypothetical protein